MATAELASASQRAILERMRTKLPRLPSGADAVIGIRSPQSPVWHGADAFDINGRPVRVAACPSVLAVLDALASQEPGSVLVLLTDQPESELGDAVLARVHDGRLLEADRSCLARHRLQLVGRWGRRSRRSRSPKRCSTWPPRPQSRP
jgi:hypothetical protein